MCTKIGHISREEVAPEPDQQEWTLALSFVQDRDTRECLEKAYNASLAKERSRWDDWHKFTDEGLAQHDEQIVQQLHTQLADSKNTARHYRELFNEIRLALRGLISVDATKQEIINRVKSLVSQLAAAEAAIKLIVDRAKSDVDCGGVMLPEGVIGIFENIDTSALDAAIEEALERATQEQKELNDCIEQTWDVLEKDSGAKAWPWGLLSAAKQVAEAQKPLVEALNFYAHGGGGIHIATEALAKIGGKQ